MYIGRIVALGWTDSGAPSLLYRLSSRSFPNRRVVITQREARIVPSPGHEADLESSPYIAYTALRTSARHAVVGNGTHTDVIADRLTSGLSMRDTLALVLTTMDFERDSHATPRIAAVVDREAGQGYLGAITRDNLVIRSVQMTPGQVWYVSTYRLCEPSPQQMVNGFEASTAEAACAFILSGRGFSCYEHPVAAVAALWQVQGWQMACADA